MKMTRRQKRAFIAQAILLIVGLVGVFVVLNSVGTIEGDYITISTQLSLNVGDFLTGFAIITVAVNLYKIIFKD